MKYFFAFAFLLLAGCSHTTNNVAPITLGPQSAIFQPGGEYYMPPGTFIGKWITTNVTNDNISTSYINQSTAVINEADSLLLGSITNDSTHEVLSVNGFHTGPTDGSYSPHLYAVRNISSLRDTDYGEYITFYTAGDTLWYADLHKVPDSNYSLSDFMITCFRK